MQPIDTREASMKLTTFINMALLLVWIFSEALSVCGIAAESEITVHGNESGDITNHRKVESSLASYLEDFILLIRHS